MTVVSWLHLNQACLEHELERLVNQLVEVEPKSLLERISFEVRREL